MATPALPFYDWGACPCETCGYRQWTAHRSATVYDTWKQERRSIAQLAAGDNVTGITSVVITFKPGLIRIDRDLPDQDLRRGDTVLTYAYRGDAMSGILASLRHVGGFLLARPAGTIGGRSHTVSSGHLAW
jgi:hypothetical protein